MSMCSSAGMAARVVQQLSDSVAVDDASSLRLSGSAGVAARVSMSQLSDAVTVGDACMSAAVWQRGCGCARVDVWQGGCGCVPLSRS